MFSNSGSTLPSNGATRLKAGSNRGLQRECVYSSSIGEEVFLSRPRADGFYWKAHRSRGRRRNQVLRLRSVVVMAHRIFGEAAGSGPKIPPKDVTQYLTVHAPAVLRDEDERRLPLGTTRS